MAKPTIFLLPGAWLPISTYEPLLDRLRQAGFPVLASGYPSQDPKGDPMEGTCARDADYLRQHCIKPAIEADGRDLVLLMHSYAGMPGAAAAFGLSKRERKAQNLKGGIVGLIMVSAFVIGEGVSCAGAMGGDTAPWVLKDNPSNGLSWPDNPRELFAADVEGPTAESMVRKLVPHATVAFFSPQPPPAFVEPSMNGLIAYVMLLNDKAVSTAGQEAMVQYSGQQWEVRKLETSHNAPFLTKTEDMLHIVEELVSLFEQRLQA